MYRQDIPEVNKGPYLFKEYGCKLSCYFYWYEQCINKYLSIDTILLTTDQLVNLKLVTDDLMITEKYEYMVPHYIGIPLIESKREGPDYPCAYNELEILWLTKTTERATYNHFTPGNGTGISTWDSLGIRHGKDDYHVAGKRIMVLDPVWTRKYWRESL